MVTDPSSIQDKKVHEFLENSWLHHFKENIDVELTISSLRYLTALKFPDPILHPRSEDMKLGFVDYCYRNWYIHAHQCQDEVSKLTFTTFQSPEAVSAAFHFFDKKCNIHCKEGSSCGSTILHLLSVCQLDQLLVSDQLGDCDTDSHQYYNDRDIEGRSPLSYAADLGNAGTVKTLLTMAGMDVNLGGQ